MVSYHIVDTFKTALLMIKQRSVTFPQDSHDMVLLPDTGQDKPASGALHHETRQHQVFPSPDWPQSAIVLDTAVTDL